MATDEKISVLYVDNEPSFLDIGKEYLEDTGLFIVDTASSAEEGIEKITHSRYDAIISDYQMRYLNGIEFLITIRKNSSIPFILLTGNNHENIIIDALNYGADYYLQKGEIPEKLFSELIIKIIRSVQRYRNKQDLIGESRVYAVKSAINAIIVRVDKRDELLRDVCRSFVEEGKFRAAWIGLQDPESIIRIVAINVLDDPDIDITNYNLLPDLNKELIQQSLTDGNHIILNSCDDSSSSDIHNSDQLLDRKYSTGLFPICLPTHVIGLFQIYAERNFFTENIGKILDEISLDISYAIEMIQYEHKRKSYEISFREKEEWFNSFIQNAEAAILIYDPSFRGSGKIIEVNKRAIELFGYTRDEFLEKPFLSLFTLNNEELIASLKKEFYERKKLHVETRILTSSKKQISVDINLQVYDLQERQLISLYIEESNEENKIEDVLTQIERLNNSILNSTCEYYYRLGRDLRFILVSSSLGQFLGYDREDNLIGKKVSDLCYDTNCDQPFVDLLNSDTDSIPRFDITLSHTNGDPAYFESYCRCFYDEQGNIAGIEGSFKNITKEKQIENLLLKSESYFQDLVDNAIDIIYSHDLNGIIRTINPAVYLYLEYLPSQLIGKSIDLVSPPEMMEKIRKKLGSITDAKPINTSYDTDLISKTGKLIPFEIHARVRYNDSKNIEIVGIARCISDRKKAEQKLAENEMKFRAIYEGTSDALIILKSERCIDCNKKALELFGLSTKEKMISKKISDFSPLNQPNGITSQNSITDYYKKFSESGGMTFEWVFAKNDGSLFPAEILLSGFTMKDELYVQVGIRDVTERKHSGESVRLANRKMHLLSSITRHDIQNSLTSMLGYLDIINEMPQNPEIAPLIKKIGTSANIIREQIEFTRDYQDIGVQAPVWQNAEKIMNQAIEKIRNSDLILDCRLHGLKILADPLLERVLFNLVENSVRHGEKVTLIRTYYQESDTELIWYIEDDGIGIPEDMKDNIFLQGVGKNTGLGLFLVREILSITGITITENGIPGEGCRFMIRPPAGTYVVKKLK